jgi:collagen type I/II/III/V/XI/XXIV/XXVII alpha
VAFTNVVVGAVDGSDSLDISGGSQFSGDFTILGEDAAATGDVTVDDSTWDGATLTVGLDGSGTATIDTGSTVSFADLVVGQNGPEGSGSIDVSGSSTLMTATAILGESAEASGSVTLNESTWNGTSLTVGQGGTGNATIETGSTVTFSDIVVGPDGELDATGAGGSPGTVIASTFTLEFGTLDVTGDGEVLIGASSGPSGAVSVDGTSSPLVGLGTLNGNVVLGNQGTVEATQPIPGSLFIDGNIHGTGTIEPLMTLEVTGGIDAGVDIAFSASVGAQVGDLVLDTPAANLGTIVGFGAGNTIDVQGSKFTDAVFTQGTSGAAGTLTLSGGGFTPLSLAVAGKYSADSFVATPGASDTVVTLCFAAGTRIATPRGEVPVEQLVAGGKVLTLSGAARPITWIGTGRVLATRGRRNSATPVIVRRGALADNVPHRDLRITKGHSLFLDGVLIPVEFLINHRTIVWDDRAQEVAIYHVELETHDVLMADGAPAESYRDDGNRWLFQNANAAWHLPPQEPCAPVLTGGPVVDALWLRLLARARPRQDVPLTDDPDLHLLVDGRRVDAVSRDDARHVFRLAVRPRQVRIRSRSGVPQELGLARDPRELGVALRHIGVAQQTRKRVMQANDVHLADGFHDFGPEKGFRRTNGDAAAPAELFAGFIGPLTVVLHVGATSRYRDPGSELRVA